MEVARYCAVSSVEQSHKVPINHIEWLPHQYEVGGVEGGGRSREVAEFDRGRWSQER